MTILGVGLTVVAVILSLAIGDRRVPAAVRIALILIALSAVVAGIIALIGELA